MNEFAVTVEDLGKRYRLAHQRERYSRLTESLASAARAPFDRMRGKPQATAESFWALRHVSFEIGHGDVVGVIGRNGAGKSTLLKILSRITEPTTGSARLTGRVGSLLEIGTGFHPELTGRENIYLSAAVLGMRRKETDRRFDEIVDFAGIERFLDTPVKRYSSGMQVRLGFAVAAHLLTEILIVDEVLAVGDAEFQRKCLGKMTDVARAGRTVLFVSHNMNAVSALCNRAILLDGGSVELQGTVEHVVQAYSDKFAERSTSGTGESLFPVVAEKAAQIERVQIVDDEGSLTHLVDLSKPFDVVMDYVVRHDVSSLIAACEVHSSNGSLVLVTIDADWANFSTLEMSDHFPRKAGTYRATIHMPAPLLNSGYYELVVYLAHGGDYIDWQRAMTLEVFDPGSFASFLFKRPRSGTVTVPIRWDVRRRPATGEPGE